MIADGQNSATAYTAENVLAELRQYESYGVTTMLSLGLNRDLLYAIREQQRQGKLDGATVFTADRGIGVPDAAPPLPAAPDQLYRPATPAEARAAVDAMAKRHADMVKIWVDSLGGTKPAMSPEIYRAVIEEAHKHHLRVAAHVYYLADAKSLVNDGVDVLAHSVRDKPVDQELISAMKRRGVWYIPTFTVDESFYIYAEHPGFMQIDFFKDALSPVLLATLTSDAYSQKVNQDPKTAQHKADFAMDQKNLKTLYDAGMSCRFWNRLRRYADPHSGILRASGTGRHGAGGAHPDAGYRVRHQEQRGVAGDRGETRNAAAGQARGPDRAGRQSTGRHHQYAIHRDHFSRWAHGCAAGSRSDGALENMRNHACTLAPWISSWQPGPASRTPAGASNLAKFFSNFSASMTAWAS